MSRFYTGVGSRSTPKKILDAMTRAAVILNGVHYTLRSGGALGADQAFEQGAALATVFRAGDCTQRAMNIAKKYHPAWDRVSEYGRKLHGRNAFQVLGYTLSTPSDFLVCWTPDGCLSHATRSRKTGGTGTAISIADAYGVKIFNLANRKSMLQFAELLKIAKE